MSVVHLVNKNSRQQMVKKNLKEYMLKEIDIIQNIISRMAFNSFMVKGWAITLIVVTLLFRGSRYQVWMASIPLIVFWFLDSYFLQQEKLYRKLYEWVIKNRLNTDEYLLDMNTCRFKSDVQSRIRIMFSVTLGWFYGLIAILIIVYAVFLLVIQKGGGC